MSWLEREPVPHRCKRPWIVLWRRRDGLRWQCDDCGKIWVVRNIGVHNEMTWEREH